MKMEKIKQKMGLNKNRRLNKKGAITLTGIFIGFFIFLTVFYGYANFMEGVAVENGYRNTTGSSIENLSSTYESLSKDFNKEVHSFGDNATGVKEPGEKYSISFNSLNGFLDVVKTILKFPSTLTKVVYGVSSNTHNLINPLWWDLLDLIIWLVLLGIFLSILLGGGGNKV